MDFVVDRNWVGWTGCPITGLKVGMAKILERGVFYVAVGLQSTLSRYRLPTMTNPNSDTVDALMTGDDLDDALAEIFPPRPDRLFLELDAETLRPLMDDADFNELQFETLVTTAELTRYFGVSPQWILLNLQERLFPTPVRLGAQAYWRVDEVADVFSYIDMNPNDNLGLRTLVRTLLETRPVVPTTVGEYRVRSGEIREASARASASKSASAITMLAGNVN